MQIFSSALFPKSCLPRLIHIFDVIKNEACVSLSALRKFVDKGRRAGGGLKNDDLLMAFKSA